MNPDPFAIFLNIIGVLGLIVVIGNGALLVRQYRQNRRRAGRPIICVCEDGDMVGVVLRQDYDRCSYTYWKTYFRDHPDAYPHQDGARVMEVTPVFAFRKGSEDHRHMMMQGLAIEMAVFSVPESPSEDGYGRALEYIWNSRR